MKWADTHWLELDGQLQRQNVDLYERSRQPMARFLALLYALLMEAIQWGDKEDREKIMEVLDWPAVTEERQLAESDRQARETMAALGIDPAVLGL